MPDRILTTEEAAALLRTSTFSVRRHAKEWGGFKMPGSRQWCFWRSKLMELTHHG